MITVLQIISGMGLGGAESYVMNMLRAINKESCRFDFLLLKQQSEGFYLEELKQYGSNIYYRSERPAYTLLLTAFRQVRTRLAFYRSHPAYDAVHIHTSSARFITELIAAKIAGIPVRIYHSHSTGCRYKLLHKLLRPFLDVFATHLFACGRDAGAWMFGRRFSRCKKCAVQYNAIELDKYRFDIGSREQIRKALGLENKAVVGLVANFSPAKNQVFLLEVFRHFHLVERDSALVLIGSGAQEQECRRLAAESGISADVLFLGVKSNVNAYLNAFDIFVMPSLYEGFPTVLIEARANGLPMLTSDRVTTECVETLGVYRLPIEQSAHIWAEMISKILRDTDIKNRANASEMMHGGRFDLQTVIKRIEDVYASPIKGKKT